LNNNLNNSTNKKNKKTKRAVSTVFIIFILAITVGLLVIFIRKKPSKTVDVCGSKYQGNLLQEAGDNLQPQSVEKLKPYVDKILGLNNYEKDPNCLYVVTLYYINISDSENSLKYYKLLSPIYPKDQQFNQSILRPIFSNEEINKNVNGLIEFQNNFSKNKAVRGE